MHVTICLGILCRSLPPAVLNVEAYRLCLAVTLIVVFFFQCLVMSLFCVQHDHPLSFVYKPGVVQVVTLTNLNKTIKRVHISSATARYYSSTVMKSSILISRAIEIISRNLTCIFGNNIIVCTETHSPTFIIDQTRLYMVWG